MNPQTQPSMLNNPVLNAEELTPCSAPLDPGVPLIKTSGTWLNDSTRTLRSSLREEVGKGEDVAKLMFVQGFKKVVLFTCSPALQVSLFIGENTSDSTFATFPMELGWQSRHCLSVKDTKVG